MGGVHPRRELQKEVRQPTSGKRDTQDGRNAPTTPTMAATIKPATTRRTEPAEQPKTTTATTTPATECRTESTDHPRKTKALSKF